MKTPAALANRIAAKPPGPSALGPEPAGLLVQASAEAGPGPVVSARLGRVSPRSRPAAAGLRPAAFARLPSASFAFPGGGAAAVPRIGVSP